MLFLLKEIYTHMESIILLFYIILVVISRRIPLLLFLHDTWSISLYKAYFMMHFDLLRRERWDALRADIVRI